LIFQIKVLFVEIWIYEGLDISKKEVDKQVKPELNNQDHKQQLQSSSIAPEKSPESSNQQLKLQKSTYNPFKQNITHQKSASETTKAQYTSTPMPMRRPKFSKLPKRRHKHCKSTKI
jgi:hypothetical protein